MLKCVQISFFVVVAHDCPPQSIFSCPPGIRSFGSGENQKAVIQFGTPLTLISGQNGAGKTVWEISLVLSSTRERSLSPAFPSHPFFFALTSVKLLAVLLGRHPAFNWQKKTEWGSGDEAIKSPRLCRLISGAFIGENCHRTISMTVTTFSYCDSFASCSQTIIECLKYATTGDQPPNTKGGAFVHDPKVKLLPTAGS